MYNHQNRDIRQFVRYVIVGLINNASIFCVYLLITYLGMEPKLAMTLLYATGAVIGYVGNKQWSFQHNGKVSSSFIRFCIANLCGYFINLSLLWYFYDILKIPYQLVQAAAIFIVAAFLFIAMRIFVFPVHDNSLKESV